MELDLRFQRLDEWMHEVKLLYNQLTHFPNADQRMVLVLELNKSLVTF